MRVRGFANATFQEDAAGGIVTLTAPALPAGGHKVNKMITIQGSFSVRDNPEKLAQIASLFESGKITLDLEEAH